VTVSHKAWRATTEDYFTLYIAIKSIAFKNFLIVFSISQGENKICSIENKKPTSVGFRI